VIVGGSRGELLGRTDTPELAALVLVGVIGDIVGAPKVDVPGDVLLGGGGQLDVPDPGGKTPVAGGAVFQELLVFCDPGAAPALLDGNWACWPLATEAVRNAVAKATKTNRNSSGRGASPLQLRLLRFDLCCAII